MTCNLSSTDLIILFSPTQRLPMAAEWKPNAFLKRSIRSCFPLKHYLSPFCARAILHTFSYLHRGFSHYSLCLNLSSSLFLLPFSHPFTWIIVPNLSFSAQKPFMLEAFPDTPLHQLWAIFCFLSFKSDDHTW